MIVRRNREDEQKVIIHLSTLLGKKRWNNSRLHKATGIRLNTIGEYYDEISLSIKFDHIVKICEALDCTLSELMEYTPTSRRKPKE